MRSVLDRLRDLERRVRGIPSRFAGGGGAATPHQAISIIGGNTAAIGAGLEGIVYASTLTPTAAFDPDVDTVYDNGLGYGVLFEGGVEVGNVLVRHSFYGYPIPVLAGDIVRVAATATINYDPGGGDPLVPMTVYLFDWV